LNPFAPHITEEIWERQAYGGSITDQTWPSYDEARTVEDTVEIVLQINGKIRARVEIPRDLAKEEALLLARQHELIAPELEGRRVVKEIYVPGSLINLVVVS